MKQDECRARMRQAAAGFVAAAYEQDGQISKATMTRYFRTLAEAEALAATFPKALRVRAYRTVGIERADEESYYPDDLTIKTPTPGCPYIDVEFAVVSLEVSFYPDAVNKGKNETGLKRLKRFLALVPSWSYQPPYCLNAATEEAFRALVGC